MDGADRPRDLIRLRALADETAGTRAERGDHVLVLLERREDQHARLRERGVGADRGGRVDAVHRRHADVHEHHVRPGLAGERDGLCTVGGLTHDHDARLGAQKLRHTRADEGLVVRQGDADHA